MVRIIKATPTEKPFPVPKISAAIEKSLSKPTLDPDCFRSMRDKWIGIKEKSPQLTDSALARCLWEIDREKKLFGPASPPTQIIGMLEGVPIKVTVGEKLIVITLNKPSLKLDREQIEGVIPKLKSIVSEVCPSAAFDDKWGQHSE